MPEDFSEISRKSVWALIQDIAAIGDVLKKELLGMNQKRV